MSLKLPKRLIACLSINLLILFFGIDFIKSVLIGVGPNELTVMP